VQAGTCTGSTPPSPALLPHDIVYCTVYCHLKAAAYKFVLRLISCSACFVETCKFIMCLFLISISRLPFVVILRCYTEAARRVLLQVLYRASFVLLLFSAV
jgi:hypothetical protein